MIKTELNRRLVYDATCRNSLVYDPQHWLPVFVFSARSGHRQRINLFLQYGRTEMLQSLPHDRIQGIISGAN